MISVILFTVSLIVARTGVTRRSARARHAPDVPQDGLFFVHSPDTLQANRRTVRLGGVIYASAPSHVISLDPTPPAVPVSLLARRYHAAMSPAV